MAGEIGRPRRRVEDHRLIRGAGRYPDDLAPRDALHAVFVRSPFAHARIRALDTAAAARAAGVVAVLTAADLPAPGPVRVAPPGRPTGPRESMQTAPGGPDFRGAPAPFLTADAARYVGDPVAMVLAETAAQARDAAALVAVDWEPLPAVAGVEDAARPGAPLVHPAFGTNVAFTTRRGTPEAELDALFARAAHVVRRHLVVNRLAGVPIQPMTAAAWPDPTIEGLSVSCTTQSPWRVRAAVGRALGIPETSVRALAPDVGGGFGTRGPVYNEYLAVAHAAHRLGRAVRWTATRSEDMLASRGARDVVADAEIAADADGRILAIRARVLLALGAYADVPGPGRRILECMNGPYDLAGMAVELSGVYTNTTPTGAYRGAGRPEASYVHERLVDALAMEIGVDPAELRRRNFIPPDRFPYKTALGPVYDSANYRPALDRALELIDYAGLRRRQADPGSADAARLVGVGIAAYVEPTAAGYESGHVRVEQSGRVTCHSGSHPQGQGHATTFAQIVADRLCVPFEHVTVRQGDTAAGPPGTGTGGSKSTALGGGALHEAAGRVLEKARRIAAHLLEASPADLVPAEGGFAVAGAPARRVEWARVAQAAYGAGLPPGMEPGLEATAYFRMPTEPWSFGACVAQVAIDRETGEVTVERLVSVDDCGTQVNPLLLAGQSHGGLAQGIGAALFEWVQYDAEGQPLTGTLMDYAVPRAEDVPTFELDHTVTPSPLNPLGVKGHGESGTIAAPPAVVNAAIDALARLGVRAIDPPLTPLRVWQALGAAEAPAR
ncbi:MAG TPA: xanthine dehydrogenase family protein molybdopterin-binding subunit [Chloroflexota bacterium]|nr:xanthine dehydrogenase family protein molybdopterin-binding subunit [Chloroflexota bacterium]